MAETLVTIVVPVYNTGKYLRQCVGSVLAQTYTHWELILVDDGSTDGSGALCDALARQDDRISVIHAANGGLSVARNRGIDAARGEYLAFLDSDDLLHPRFLEIMAGTACRSGADVTVCLNERFDDGQESSPPLLNDREKGTDFRPEMPESPLSVVADILYQRGGMEASACGKLYASRLWKESRFRPGIGYEDLDLIPRIMAESRRTAVISLPLYLYRQHGASYLHVFTLRRADVLDVTSRLVEYMRRHHPSLVKAALDRQLSANYNIFGLICANRRSLDSATLAEAGRIADECWRRIKELRLSSLLDLGVRLKNKAGILAGYIGGRPLVAALSRRVYRP